VTSDPEGIDCGADCTETYPQNQVVTLTAQADTGSAFAGWTGDADCEDGVVSMTTDRSCIASFGKNSYPVTATATAGANGTIDPSSRTVAHGATTTFTVTPTTGYSASVTGCGGSLSGTTYTTGAITAACAVTATFTQASYTVTATANPTAGGTVSCSPTTVVQGGSSLCTATIANGYGFANWSGHCTGASLNCTLTNITGPRSVTANFSALSGILDATHSAPSYRAGSLLTVSGRLNDTSGATPLALLWHPHLPAGWTLQSVTGEGEPALSPDGTEILFTGSLAAMPIDFSYQVAVPLDAVGEQAIRATIEYQNAGMANALTLAPQPNPLTLTPITYHSADYREARWQIDSSEASRVLAYWRATAYHPDAAGIDGYAPGSGSTDGNRHSADYRAPHWQIDSSEANRVLAYWRATAYHVDPAGVDGYAPGAGTAASALASATPSADPMAEIGAAGAVSAVTLDMPSHSAPGYVPGGTLTITNNLSRPADTTLLSLLWRPTLPTGWTITAVSGSGAPDLSPDGTEILFTGSLAANPLEFTYQVSVPADANGEFSLSAVIEYMTLGSVNPESASVAPNPLAMTEQTEEDLILENLAVTTAASYQASGMITVMGTVGVQAGGTLTLQAGRRIRFLPGFQVRSGGTLNARIVPSP
jgi:hypothetical protein